MWPTFEIPVPRQRCLHLGLWCCGYWFRRWYGRSRSAGLPFLSHPERWQIFRALRKNEKNCHLTRLEGWCYSSVQCPCFLGLKNSQKIKLSNLFFWKQKQDQNSLANARSFFSTKKWPRPVFYFLFSSGLGWILFSKETFFLALRQDTAPAVFTDEETTTRKQGFIPTRNVSARYPGPGSDSRKPVGSKPSIRVFVCRRKICRQYFTK